MGRGRIPMKLISREKARKTTFIKRKKGLMKKVYEFSTLCGVDVCVIIYGPNFDDDDNNGKIVEPETWPQDIDKVNRIIQKYYDTTSDRRPKIYDVQEYYKDRIQKVEAEISKVHKEKLKIMYPTWDESFNDLREDQLRMFVSVLDAKIDSCNQRINFLKQVGPKGKSIVEPNKVDDETIIIDPSSSSSYLNFIHNNMSHQEEQIFPPPLMNPNPISSEMNKQQLLFYPFQFGESSSSSKSCSMLQFDQDSMQLMGKSNNGMMMNWGDEQVGYGSFNYDAKIIDHMVKDNNGAHNQSDENSLLSSSPYYYGNIQQTMEPYTTSFASHEDPSIQFQATSFQNVMDVPPGFQINGL